MQSLVLCMCRLVFSFISCVLCNKLHVVFVSNPPLGVNLGLISDVFCHAIVNVVWMMSSCNQKTHANLNGAPSITIVKLNGDAGEVSIF